MRLVNIEKLYMREDDHLAMVDGQCYEVMQIGDITINGVDEYYWRAMGKGELTDEWELIEPCDEVPDYLVM